MNRPVKPISLLIILLIFLPFSIANCFSFEQPPSGLAIKEKLRVPIYYAATSGVPPQSMEAFLKKPTAFKMEARYIVDNFSARQNNQLWLNAILTSNSRSELRAFENAILQFSQLIKVDMYKGDRLVFSINPYQGTYLSINNVDIGVITDLKFQTALVSIWFGERQPSKKFAIEIREQPSSKLLREFEALEITNERTKSLKSLRIATATPPSVTTSPTDKKELSATLQVAESKKPLDAKIRPAPAIKQSKIKPENKTITSQTNVIAQATDNPSPTIKPNKLAQIETPNHSTEQSDAAKLPPKVAVLNDVSVVDQMFNLLQQDYQAELKQYIEQNARPAPPIGTRKKPEGTATIKVQLRSENNKVIVADSRIVRADFDDNLLEAMQQSIKRLKSMPPVPEAIHDQIINIEVTLDFSRCKRATSVWICF